MCFWSDCLLFQDEKAIESKGRELEKLERELEGLLEKSTKDEETLATAQKHYQAVSAGLSKNTEGEDATLADQLMGNEVSERYDQQAHKNILHYFVLGLLFFTVSNNSCLHLAVISTNDKI